MAEDDDLNQPGDEEDPNAQNQTFQQWLNWTHANVAHLRCLLKLADRIDYAQEDDDGAFEDCDIESDDGETQ